MRGLAALLILRERIHKCFQAFTVGCRELDLQGVRQPALEAPLPAFPAVMQVSAAASKLAGRVHQNSLWGPHQADELPLGKDGAAAHTGSLRDVFYALDSFLWHLNSLNPSAPGCPQAGDPG